MTPLLERLAIVFRIAEIRRAGEELASAVDLTGRHEFIGSDDAKTVAEFITNQVLPALASRHREVGGLKASLMDEVGDELRVLVIRMRRNMQDAPHLPQLMQLTEDL